MNVRTKAIFMIVGVVLAYDYRISTVKTRRFEDLQKRYSKYVETAENTMRYYEKLLDTNNIPQTDFDRVILNSF